MALQPCRECGKMVSTEAATCPDCGVPNPTASIGFAKPVIQNANALETNVYEAHVHWVVYLQAAAVALLGVATIVVTHAADIAPYAGIGVLAVAAGLGIVAFLKTTTTEFLITNRRLIVKRGITSRRTLETLLEKVEAVTVEQHLMGRIFGYGKVTVIGTGGTSETFSLVSDPMHLRQVIHDQIDRRRS
jgi:uncharacterized membrane protein YdbT with pleckstrin-like domain